MDHLVHGSKQDMAIIYMAKVSKLWRILISKQTKWCSIGKDKQYDNKKCI